VAGSTGSVILQFGRQGRQNYYRGSVSRRKFQELVKRTNACSDMMIERNEKEITRTRERWNILRFLNTTQVCTLTTQRHDNALQVSLYVNIHCEYYVCQNIMYVRYTAEGESVIMVCRSCHIAYGSKTMDFMAKYEMVSEGGERALSYVCNTTFCKISLAIMHELFS
jgi:hypothetical protein